jgi:prevent-host-death family protein
MWSDEVVMKKRTIAATQFKAECLSLLDEIERGQTEITVTRRGVPVARLVPLEASPQRRKLTGRIVGDIVNFGEPEWIR